MSQHSTYIGMAGASHTVISVDAKGRKKAHHHEDEKRMELSMHMNCYDASDTKNIRINKGNFTL